jgi:hypothetical protein
MLAKYWNVKKLRQSIIPAIAVLLVGVLIGAVLVWRDHLDNLAEAAALTGRVAEVNQKIAETPAPPSDLAAGLAAARDGLAEAGAALPAAIERNDVVDYIINLADKYRVEAIPLIVEGWSPESPGSPYNVLKLNVTVAGRLDGVTRLLVALQASEYPSLTISDLSVNRLDQPDNSTGFGDATLVTAGMNIALYTYTPVAQENVTS